MTNAFKLLDHAAIVTWGTLMKSKVTNEVSKRAPPGLQLGLFGFLSTPRPRYSPAPLRIQRLPILVAHLRPW